MSWGRISDDYLDNPKVIAAGAAWPLHFAGILYCAAQLSDGRIPSGAVAVLASEAGEEEP